MAEAEVWDIVAIAMEKKEAEMRGLLKECADSLEYLTLTKAFTKSELKTHCETLIEKIRKAQEENDG